LRFFVKVLEVSACGGEGGKTPYGRFSSN